MPKFKKEMKRLSDIPAQNITHKKSGIKLVTTKDFLTQHTILKNLHKKCAKSYSGMPNRTSLGFKKTEKPYEFADF